MATSRLAALRTAKLCAGFGHDVAFTPFPPLAVHLTHNEKVAQKEFHLTHSMIKAIDKQIKARSVVDLQNTIAELKL